MPSAQKIPQSLTTAQQLGSLIKSARDIMRKDKGLNGDLDRLPMLTWIMFLKFLDDMEQVREQEALMASKRFRPAIEPPYRWRDWAVRPDGITGDELIAFVNNETVQDRQTLQTASIFGGEAKSLPYLLAQMNLLLHGLESPQIDPGNSLRFPLREMTDKDRVDILLTNPPFGGEAERGILSNFPDDKQTAETALLFLQLIMRKLRRRNAPSGDPPGRPCDRMDGSYARTGVVVPNGTLFGDGICARIKEELLREFNLHTIVRLPNGVFAPYTSIPTNLLFFDRSGPTKEVWYYKQPLPEGRKQYTKTQPIQYEEFAPCLAWWKDREANERAWRVPVERILENGCNLDMKNPSSKADFEHLPPEQLVEDILKKEQRIMEIMGEIKRALAEGITL